MSGASNGPRRGVAWMLAVGSAAVLALGVAACGGDDDSGGSSSSGGGGGGDQITVGLITKTESNPFFVKMKQAAQKAADQNNAKLVSAAGKQDLDNQSQVTALENMTTQGAKGIMITPAVTKAIVPAIEKARAAGLRVGLTLNLETPIEAAVPYLAAIDDVMLMSIRPGWSYQQLHPEVYERLAAMRAEIDRQGLDVALEIDGGVKIDNAQRAIDAGATVLIAASGIFAQPDPAEAARALAAIAEGASLGA